MSKKGRRHTAENHRNAWILFPAFVWFQSSTFSLASEFLCFNSFKLLDLCYSDAWKYIHLPAKTDFSFLYGSWWQRWDSNPRLLDASAVKSNARLRPLGASLYWFSNFPAVDSRRESAKFRPLNRLIFQTVRVLFSPLQSFGVFSFLAFFRPTTSGAEALRSGLRHSISDLQ